MTTANAEISAGDRFGFGQNWLEFVELVDDTRIEMSIEALKNMLKVDTLEGLTFLDVGSGSGLSSLAAWRLGATVHSFDFDPSSVACTRELRDRFAGSDSTRWEIEQGSALDASYLSGLGTFDVVYSWGVLHHTGDMWTALANMVDLVDDGGALFISIYNDQGRASRTWTKVKKSYNSAGDAGRRAIVEAARGYFALRRMDPLRRAYRIARRLPAPKSTVRPRGMDRQRDLVDWVGGWPFEVAKPEQIFDLYHDRGFTLERLSTCAGGLGCNEFVFRKDASLV